MDRDTFIRRYSIQLVYNSVGKKEDYRKFWQGGGNPFQRMRDKKTALSVATGVSKSNFLLVYSKVKLVGWSKKG